MGNAQNRNENKEKRKLKTLNHKLQISNRKNKIKLEQSVIFKVKKKIMSKKKQR
jgi:hypothetical protein